MATHSRIPRLTAFSLTLLGHVEAPFHLSVLYSFGLGVQKDEIEGATLLSKAAAGFLAALPIASGTNFSAKRHCSPLKKRGANQSIFGPRQFDHLPKE